MKKIVLFSISSLFLIGCSTTKKIGNNANASKTPINTSINISKVVDDKVPVTINPGVFASETVIYRLPKVIPGTYAVSSFGRFIDDFKALDYNGNALSVTKIDENSWEVSNATKLDKITYLVNDTFDLETQGGIGKDIPFSPAGTNIEPDNFVLNLHGFIGYFDSLKNNQYNIALTSPSSFNSSSAIQSVSQKINEDNTTTTNYFAPRYFDITDNPMFYGNLDIETFEVGGIKVVLSVYSPNKIHSAKQIKETVFNMMKAQKAYLGDINSTSRYDIYLYLAGENEDAPKGFGALEHHTSTIVVLPESSSVERLSSSMIDVVSHEFFHIVTPLSVHSEDVHYFDYQAPTFSKHLWMYEGVTEYFASVFQITQGLVTEEEFLNKIMTKIKRSQRYDDTMSFTEMSEHILDEKYAPAYVNVYQKGALIGMCIDILLREESNGNRGTLSLLKELSLKYGKNKPFEDDKLIDEIVAMTYPSLRSFFDNHVIGTTPIDYNNFFEKVGLEIAESKIETNYIQSSGGLLLARNRENGTFYFSDAVTQNSFWNEQGVLPNDTLKSVGGIALTTTNVQQVLGGIFGWKPEASYEIVVTRNGKDIPFKGTLTQAYTSGKALKANKSATDAQKALKKAWLKG